MAVGLADLNRLAEADVLLGNSMGEMTLYYSAGEVTSTGGSLLSLGGQNLTETCAIDMPVVIGPYTSDFTQATCNAVAADVCVQVADAVITARIIDAWLPDTDIREAAPRAVLAFTATYDNAMVCTAEAVVSLILPAL